MATRIWIGTSTAGDYSVAANWTTATVPEAGDDVVFENSTQAVTAGFDQSAIALASFTVKQSYTGAIGTIAGSTVVYLQVAATTVTIGDHDGYSSPTGSNQLLLDFGSSTPATITVHNTATTATDTDIMPLQILAANASTKLFVRRGKVGVANAKSGETSTIDTIDSAWVTNKASDSQISVGSGVTLETWNQTGGSCTLNSATTTALTLIDGTLTTNGTGTHVVCNIWGGRFTSNSTGTITTLNCRGGVSDFLLSNAARTVTTTDVWPGMTLRSDPAVVTYTNDPEQQVEGILTVTAI